jgi:hypothetical protein
MTGRVKFATSTAPSPPLADLVSNPTPPGQLAREWVSSVDVRLGRDSDNHKLPRFNFHAGRHGKELQTGD